MIPAFRQAANFKKWTFGAVLGIATALASVNEAQAAFIAGGSVEDYVISDLKQDGAQLSELDQLTIINATQKSANAYKGYITNLNRFEGAPDAARFQEINTFKSPQLYEMLVYGGETFSPSSYAGVFDKLEAEMAKKGRTSIFEIAKNNFHASVIPFLNNAVAYNAADRAAAYIQPTQWPEVLDMFAARISLGDKSAMSTLANVMQATDDPQTRLVMEEFLQSQFDGARNPAAKDAFGLTAGAYNALTGNNAITLDRPALYEPRVAAALDQSDVFGSDGVHRQLMVFATNEPDVQEKFASLMQTYQADANYQIQNFNSFVKISSLSGNPVEIFANKPDGSPNDIFEAILGTDGYDYGDVEFDAVIDRSSYPFRDTINPYEQARVKIVFAGQNGDAANTQAILNSAPDAHIISTPRTVNPANPDPLLHNVAESIRLNGVVDWAQQGDFLRVLGQGDDFILPPENKTLTITYSIQKIASERELGAMRPARRPSALESAAGLDPSRG